MMKPGKWLVKLLIASSMNPSRQFQPTEEPLGSGAVTDVKHAQMRVGDQLVMGSTGISADFMGEKLAKRFEGLVRSIGLRFLTYEATIHGKVSVKSSSLTAGNLHACFQYVMNMIFVFFSIC